LFSGCPGSHIVVVSGGVERVCLDGVTASETTLAGVGLGSEGLVPLEAGGGEGDLGDLSDLSDLLSSSVDGIIGSVGSVISDILGLIDSIGGIVRPAIIITLHVFVFKAVRILFFDSLFCDRFLSVGGSLC